MSIALYIALDQPIEGIDPNIPERVNVVRISEQLDALAAKAGVRKISDFASFTPDEVPFEFPEETELPPVQWFDPAEGLHTIQSLLAAIPEAGRLIVEEPHLRSQLLQRRAAPPARPPRDVTESVVQELHGCAAVLEAARQGGRKFRFYLVP